MGGAPDFLIPPVGSPVIWATRGRKAGELGAGVWAITWEAQEGATFPRGVWVIGAAVPAAEGLSLCHSPPCFGWRPGEGRGRGPAPTTSCPPPGPGANGHATPLLPTCREVSRRPLGAQSLLRAGAAAQSGRRGLHLPSLADGVSKEGRVSSRPPGPEPGPQGHLSPRMPGRPAFPARGGRPGRLSSPRDFPFGATFACVTGSPRTAASGPGCRC